MSESKGPSSIKIGEQANLRLLEGRGVEQRGVVRDRGQGAEVYRTCVKKDLATVKSSIVQDT
jgi:hypothetical protein